MATSFRSPRRRPTAWTLFVCLLAAASFSTHASAKKETSRPTKAPHGAVLGIYVLGPREVVAGTPAAFRVTVHWSSAPGVHGALSGAKLELSLKSKRRRYGLAKATSDARGTAMVAFTVPPQLPEGDYALHLAAKSGSARAEQKQTLRIVAGAQLFLTTDKPLYRPGQTLRVRALALRRIDRKPLAQKDLRFRVYDPRGTCIFDRKVRSSAFGIAATELPLASEVNLGRYRVAVVLGKDGTQRNRSVRVTRYQLPRFEVSMRTDRRHYRPGDRLTGSVVARYLHGEPLRDASVQLDIKRWLCPERTIERCRERSYRLHLTTDKRGRARFSQLLLAGPLELLFVRGRLDLRAAVTDDVGSRREGVLAVPYSPLRMRIALVVPGGELLQGVAQKVHVLATRSDGRPLRAARVRVRSGKVEVQAKTDGLGAATLTLQPTSTCRVRRRWRPRHGASLEITVDDPWGNQRIIERCVPLVRRALRVELTRHLLARKQRLDLVLRAKAKDGELAFVDLLEGGQTLSSHQGRFVGGEARLSIAPPAGTEGLIVVRAYRLARGAERQAQLAAVWIEPRSPLRIEAKLDKREYRPGGKAVLTLHVTRAGRGVSAALGLRAVDRALLVLAPEEPEAEPLLRSLANWATPQSARLPLKPAGRSLRRWITAKETGAARRRATEILLAALRPPRTSVWETDPWTERQQRWTTQRDAIVEAARAGVSELALGKRTSRGWVFHPRVVAHLVRAKKLPRGSERDPWNRPVLGAQLPTFDANLVFATLAKEAARAKVDALYELLEKHRKTLRLARRAIKGFTREQQPIILPSNLLVRLARRKDVKKHLFVDPWGQRLRLVRHRRLLLIHGDWTTQDELLSLGPDGRLGTADDVRTEHATQRIGPRGLKGALCSAGICGQACDACGYSGRGSGGMLGGRYARAPRVVAGRAMVGGSLGGRHGDREGPRVRSRFPETLLWKPEVLTDARGRARVDIPLADSITTWRLFANASTQQGLFGRTALDLRVFQPFFADVDLPSNLTVGDRLELPVTVSNYRKKPLSVTLVLNPQRWLKLDGPPRQQLVVEPGRVAVHYFSVTVQHAGQHALRIFARARDEDGKLVQDAIERRAEVEPDGQPAAQTISGMLRKDAELELVLPSTMLASTSRVQLQLEPGPLSQSVSGLDGLIRRPHGCFEQTSATVYPNLLVLDYLRKNRQSTPAIEKRALGFLAEGYQRLLTFEVKGGGFSWFGRAPANQVLTAYGLAEFAHLSRLQKVDPKVIERTRAWLLSRQQQDGSWPLDTRNINDGVVNRKAGSRVRVTAYIATALLDSGYRGKALERALAFLRPHAERAKDAYTLALLANLYAPRRKDALRGRLLDRLWALRQPGQRGVTLPGPNATLTHAAGGSGDLETTALAALAMLQSRDRPAAAAKLLGALIGQRGRFGAWSTTQATVLGLRALLLDRHGSLPRGRLEVLVAGKTVKTLRLAGREDRVQVVDLTHVAATPGRHEIALRFHGKGRLLYRLVGSYWLPRDGLRAKNATLGIAAHYDRATLRAGEAVKLTLKLQNSGKRAVAMPLVSLPLPPGFDLAPNAIERLVAGTLVSKVQQRGSQLVLYLERLEAGAKHHLALSLRPRFPLTVQARQPLIYEYYRPENRALGQLTTLTVRSAPKRPGPKTAKLDPLAPLDRLLANVR